jgi:Ni/Fe-hydrogenase subunit HybB-like protein
MQERRVVPSPQVNDELLRFVLRPPPLWFWLLAGLLALGATAGVVAVVIMVVFGLEVLGYTHMHQWQIPISHFVFLVGVSHAGVMISAVLRLSRAEWRRPVTRAAELLTVFALVTAALFPVIHTGRPWRTIYWTFPYDFTRNIWPNFRSALAWDASSIFTYLFGTILFVYIAMIPDLAVLRDRSDGWRHRFYGALSLGFRGTSRQWYVQGLADVLLAALILPVFVSVHSTVAANFNMAIVPGWHTTILGPYYVISAVHSGIAAVITLMAILRVLLRLQNYITADHFDAVGRLQIAVTTVWVFVYLVDLYYALMTRDPMEVLTWQLQLFTWPFNVLTVVFILTAFVIPYPLWFFRRFRRSVAIMFWTTLLVNVGMWIERYILVVAPLSLQSPFVFTWITTPTPRLLDFALVIGSLSAVGLGILLFAKFFPIVPLFDVKEERILKQQVRVGRRVVPGVIRASTEGEVSA